MKTRSARTTKAILMPIIALLGLAWMLGSVCYAEPAKKPVVPAIELVDRDIETLHTIDNRLAAANDSVKFLAFWGPLVDALATNPATRLTKDITSDDFSSLAAGIKAASNLKKIALLSCVEDCKTMVVFHRSSRGKGAKHVKFWKSMQDFYAAQAKAIGSDKDRPC